jgi:hypothetical protein
MPTVLKDGDVRFLRGMDPSADPRTLPEGAYAWAENLINREGALAVRPGFDWCMTLPPGTPQGLAVFTPRNGLPQLVAFVNGECYSSAYPFSGYRKVGGVKLSEHAECVYTCQATKSVERNLDDSLKLVEAHELLMLQDGISPPAYFDGHEVATAAGTQGTPAGTHMVYAGGRLWVARKNKIFACDFADPLSSYEQTYNTLGGINYYLLPGECTGLTRTPGGLDGLSAQVLAFCANSATVFRSDILTRSQWLEVDNFQSEVLPGVGCVSHRSIVAENGLIWWNSSKGYTRLDVAQFVRESSKVPTIDPELEALKPLYGPINRSCAVYHNNMLLHSVPLESRKNTHTFVFDEAIKDRTSGQSAPPAWVSAWTGVNPVQWVKVDFAGRTRVFVLSSDDDGHNRIYEAFCSAPLDNGCDISWCFESRGYSANTSERKLIRWAEYSLEDVLGDLDLLVSWAGSGRGRWKAAGTARHSAQTGIFDTQTEITSESKLFSLKGQARESRTQSINLFPEDTLTTSGIEGVTADANATTERVDDSFSIRIDGSGRAVVRKIAVVMDMTNLPTTGEVVPEESSDRMTRYDGAASTSATSLATPPTTYSATATQTAVHGVGGVFTGTGVATVKSVISEQSAEKEATQRARAAAEEQMRYLAPKHVGT